MTGNIRTAAFDVVVEIFTQFSSPAERARKWAGMRKALKPGGLLIVQGYTPKQLQYGTGGPKQIENLYTRDMLVKAFGDFHDVKIVEEELRVARRHVARRHVGGDQPDGAEVNRNSTARTCPRPSSWGCAASQPT